MNNTSAKIKKTLHLDKILAAQYEYGIKNSLSRNLTNFHYRGCSSKRSIELRQGCGKSRLRRFPIPIADWKKRSFLRLKRSRLKAMSLQSLRNLPSLKSGKYGTYRSQIFLTIVKKRALISRKSREKRICRKKAVAKLGELSRATLCWACLLGWQNM